MHVKSETIQEIMRLNRSAKFEFLSAFAAEDLDHYLVRLQEARSCRHFPMGEVSDTILLGPRPQTVYSE